MPTFDVALPNKFLLKTNCNIPAGHFRLSCYFVTQEQFEADNTAYARMGFVGETETLALTQNEWLQVTNAGSDLWSGTGTTANNNVTYLDDTFVIGKAGTYKVDVDLTLDGLTGSVIEVAIFVNGSIASTYLGTVEYGADVQAQLSYTDFLIFEKNDVVDVRVRNTASGDDVDAIVGNANILKVSK